MVNDKFTLFRAELNTFNYKLVELRKKKEDDPHNEHFTNFRK